MTDSVPNDAALARVAELAREAADSPVAPEVHARGRSRVMASASSLNSNSRSTRDSWKWAVGVLAAAAFAVVLWSTTRLRSLSYDITGGSGFESGYVSAATDRPLAIHFSDGSAIDAHAGTRLRVQDTRHDGARVLVERGTLQAHIRHAKGSSWQFVAGPFEVHVVGTQFTLVWEPSKEEVDLSLQEGVVEINSPLGQGPFAVHKGQHFHASLLSHSVQLQDSSTATTDDESSRTDLELSPTSSNTSEMVSPDTSGTEARTPPTIGTSSATSPKPTRADSWSAWVSHGRFQDVVTAAQAQGVDACLDACSLSDLRSLADAARYTGHANLAEQSLLAIRKRSTAGSQRAAAAFLLGRLSESRGQVSAANTWYDTCLSEAPRGEFAADSLAGRMRYIARMSGNAAAKPLAMQYLQRYPNGAQADTARQIAQGD